MPLPHTPRLHLLLCAAFFTILNVGVQAQAAAEPTAQAVPQTAAQWRDAAARDIQAGYTITLENHPGIYDRANPKFLKNLQAAKQFGLELAAKVQDAPGYIAALQGFNVRIHDGHAGMFAKLDPSMLPPERWPGFLTVWRGDALLVAASESDQPAIGAKVLSCDTQPISTLIARNVFTFRGRIDEPGQWWSQARNVFIDRGNPFIQLPQRCEFDANGTVSTQDLAWKTMNDQAKQWLEDSYNGDKLAVGVTEPRPHLLWVAMPSFQPDDKQRDAYRALYDDVQQHRQRYLGADAIVIDLRHNQGGSSRWSQDFAQALWGKDRLERRLEAYSAKTEVWWRASKGNTAHMEGLVKSLTDEKQMEAAQWAQSAAKGMKAALKKGRKFFVETNGDNPPSTKGMNPNKDVAGDPPAMTKPVYVVVPGQCASACLDALDAFTRFPNTKLIGAPSSADSTYMDIRTQPVDSRLAMVVIPNKVYVNRARANGQVYMPAIEVRDVEWSTGNLMAVVEKDLVATNKAGAADKELGVAQPHGFVRSIDCNQVKLGALHHAQ